MPGFASSVMLASPPGAAVNMPMESESTKDCSTGERTMFPVK